MVLPSLKSEKNIMATIAIITGASGVSEDAVNNYLQGKLKSTGSVCHEHQHHDECGE